MAATLLSRHLLKKLLLIALLVSFGDNFAYAEGNNAKIPSDLSYDQPSPYGRVQVQQAEPNYYRLRINSFYNCQVPRYGKDKSWYPMWYADLLTNMKHDISKVLYIGLGCGNAPKTLSNHNHIQHIDVVEINRKVIQAYKKIFDKRHDLFRNPKVKIHQADGANVLRRGQLNGQDVAYDSIMVTLSSPIVIYESRLFTLEYIKHSKKMLKEDGVFALWIPNVNIETLKIMYNTINQVYKHTRLRLDPNNNWSSMIFASNHEIKFAQSQNKPEKLNYIQNVYKHPNTDVNTLEDPTLLRYIDKHYYSSWPSLIKKEHNKNLFYNDK